MQFFEPPQLFGFVVVFFVVFFFIVFSPALTSNSAVNILRTCHVRRCKFVSVEVGSMSVKDSGLHHYKIWAHNGSVCEDVYAPEDFTSFSDE